MRLTLAGQIVFWLVTVTVLSLAIIGGVTLSEWAATGCWWWSCV